MADHKKVDIRPNDVLPPVAEYEELLDQALDRFLHSVWSNAGTPRVNGALLALQKHMVRGVLAQLSYQWACVTALVRHTSGSTALLPLGTLAQFLTRSDAQLAGQYHEFMAATGLGGEANSAN